ncbi:MAG: DUF2851 family protein [Verrucomicrobiota bacterium]|nr:DUF2851 family protein [Verrucomicrobiota bacterium]MDG1892416.1 DUF2851 family protein [Verrucomicrobiota bacterium]
MTIPSNFYHHWRSAAMASLEIKETPIKPPRERALHLVWMHQRFDTSNCTTTTGEKIQILHPGFWNHGHGPDFRSAALKLNGRTIAEADIEIDVKTSFWYSHRHDLNPDFGKVKLHVVWDGHVPSNHPLPVLALSNHLDQPIEPLQDWAGDSGMETWPEWIRGKCSKPLRAANPESIQTVARQAALMRLQAKARRIEKEARDEGFERTLWRNLLSGLGYQNNQWPMRQIAGMTQAITEDLPEVDHRQSILTLQARLFGIANLLPDEISTAHASNRMYLRKLWDIWWRDRAIFENSILPRCIWHMQGIRPANHPLRRLATTAHWLLNQRFQEELETWFQTPMQSWVAQAKIMEILGGYADEFWSRHWTLKGPVMKKPSPLTGPQRTNDLVINVILPWFLARSRGARKDEQIKRIKRLYLHWPKSDDNKLLKLARDRLLGGSKCLWIKTAADQQGLLQILQDFCSHADANCNNCLFPDIVKSLSVEGSQ